MLFINTPLLSLRKLCKIRFKLEDVINIQTHSARGKYYLVRFVFFIFCNNYTKNCQVSE